MQIEYLADQMEAAALLAGWHHAEWRESTLEEAAAELRSHTGRRQIPTTLVALDHGRVMGSASLLVADLVGWEHLSPWLASVFVAPDFRGKGVGRALISRAFDDARRLSIRKLYLYTAGARDYYARFGWLEFEHATHANGTPIVIMHRSLAAGSADSTT